MPKKATSKLELYTKTTACAQSSELSLETRKKQAEEPMYLKRM